MTSETLTDPAARTAQHRRAIADFAALFDYDMTYQERLLDGSLEAFEAFAHAMPTSSFRRALAKDVHFVARLGAMVGEDCGDCVRVNARMAVRAGVGREVVQAAIEAPGRLVPLLADVRGHAFDVTRGVVADGGRTARLQRALGADGFAELAVVLAGCRLFTTAKRALGFGQARVVTGEDY